MGEGEQLGGSCEGSLQIIIRWGPPGLCPTWRYLARRGAFSATRGPGPASLRPGPRDRTGHLATARARAEMGNVLEVEELQITFLSPMVKVGMVSPVVKTSQDCDCSRGTDRRRDQVARALVGGIRIGPR